MLPADDVSFLNRHLFQWAVQPESGFVCIVIRGYALPPGFDVATSDLLVRLPLGFPDAVPDMWWFDPPLRIARTGAMPPASEVIETHLGRSWQRWSRHFPTGAWRPGRSGLESFFALIRKELNKWAAT
jgi:hypothetical protein